MRPALVAAPLLLAAPPPASAAPLFTGVFEWSVLETGAPPPYILSLEIVDGQWPDALVAFVDLTADGPLGLPEDPWCGLAPPSFLPPPSLDLAFCSESLRTAGQDTVAVTGGVTAAVLYLQAASGMLDPVAALSRPGALMFRYPTSPPAVPEPATLVMLGLGMLAAGAVLRRARAQPAGRGTPDRSRAANAPTHAPARGSSPGCR